MVVGLPLMAGIAILHCDGIFTWIKEHSCVVVFLQQVVHFKLCSS